MSDNIALIKRFEHAFAANDVAVIDELSDPNLLDHNPLPDQRPGLAGFKDTIAFYDATFPGTKVELHHVFGQGDLVATHWTVSGTHKGEFFGIPATGRDVSVEGMNVYRVVDGKVTDVWTQFDGLGLMEQLGAGPG
jgi:steroid delta-isomerase-like uncharacterized protein